MTDRGNFFSFFFRWAAGRGGPARMQGGGSSSRSGERLVREGWVTKESRHWGRWRLRWLVLKYEPASGLPVLATYRSASPSWELGLVPRATEQLRLVGATCYRCPVEDGMSGGRPHAFAVNLHGRDFLFACASADEMTQWVRAISMSLAELALRLGGVATGVASLDGSSGYEPFRPAQALAAYGTHAAPGQGIIPAGGLRDAIIPGGGLRDASSGGGSPSQWYSGRGGSSQSSQSGASTPPVRPTASCVHPLAAVAARVAGAGAEAGRAVEAEGGWAAIPEGGRAADVSAAEGLRGGVSWPRPMEGNVCGGQAPRPAAMCQAGCAGESGTTKGTMQGSACGVGALRIATMREAGCGTALGLPSPTLGEEAGCESESGPASPVLQAACGSGCGASSIACAPERESACAGVNDSTSGHEAEFGAGSGAESGLRGGGSGAVSHPAAGGGTSNPILNTAGSGDHLGLISDPFPLPSASLADLGLIPNPSPDNSNGRSHLGHISDPAPEEGASISGRGHEDGASISGRSPDDLEAENESLKQYIERLHGSLDAVALQQVSAGLGRGVVGGGGPTRSCAGVLVN
jgi:hypothetical protein